MRATLPWIGLAMTIVAVPMLASARLPGLGVTLLCLAAVMTVGILWERWRYRGILGSVPRGPDWAATEERFVDPGSGRTVTVYFNARSGERAYVAIKP